ncbi:MAG TPA: fatty acid desaturase [Pseudorhizobium sp.]|jgi:fatty acid desaturase|nr:fatty acid desaturase [Pseudorhizobium sp.]
MEYAVMAALAALCIQAADLWYHRFDFGKVPVPASSGVAVRHYRRHFRSLASKPYDNLLAPLTYLRILLWIFAANVVFHEADNILIDALAVLFVAGRFRSLQEVGHHAAHGSLCPNRRFGEIMTNLLYQFPAFMPEIRARHQIHVVTHHHSVNMPHDSDLKELADKGFTPGITEAAFWLGFLHPLTPAGLFARLKECYRYLADDFGTPAFYLRILSVVAVISAYVSVGGYAELFWLYLAQILIFYPLFYWIAHVSLHRWFAECADDIPYHQREIELGRPTDFPGISGAIIRNNLFPFGDSYHLAHSLFPAVRWNYLSGVDRLMRQASPEYEQHASSGLVFSRKGRPSAISELRERMVRKRPPKTVLAGQSA